MTLRLLPALLAALAIVPAARAQDPVRLPGIVVRALVDKPGANIIHGVVRDTSAFAIEGVEITIASRQKRVISDSAGKFRLTDIRPGTYEVRARRIGYAPQIREVKVDAAGGVITFELLAHIRPLPPVISAAARGGLSGTVGDTSYRAVEHAKVQLLGKGRTVGTDSLGRFFFPVGAARYVVAIRQDGYEDKLVSVTVPEDSGRHMTVLMPPCKRDLTVRQAWNVDDFGRRLMLRTNSTSWLFTREDLERLGFDWVIDAVNRGFSLAGGKWAVSNECYGTLNGGPDIVLIRTLTVDDLETVEIYPDMSQAQTVAQRPPGINSIGGKKGVADSRAATKVPMNNARDAAFMNQGIRPPCHVTYIWTR